MSHGLQVWKVFWRAVQVKATGNLNQLDPFKRHWRTNKFERAIGSGLGPAASRPGPITTRLGDSTNFELPLLAVLRLGRPLTRTPSQAPSPSLPDRDRDTDSEHPRIQLEAGGTQRAACQCEYSASHRTPALSEHQPADLRQPRRHTHSVPGMSKYTLRRGVVN